MFDIIEWIKNLINQMSPMKKRFKIPNENYPGAI